MAEDDVRGAALVTGGAIRLGRAMALGLARHGLDVAVHYNSSSRDADAVVAEMQALGVRAAALQADLTDTDQTDGLVPAAAEALGRPLTVLVNNASTFEYDRIETATHANWDHHIATNLRALFFLTQAFAAQCPPLREQDGEPLASGLVVNMVDQRVLKPTPEFMTYSLAKAGLWAFTRTAAQGLGPRIRVNAIGPGPTIRGTSQSEEDFARQRAATVLERGGDAEGVVAALLYLLQARAVTGQLLCVDGGQHLQWRTRDILGTYRRAEAGPGGKLST